MKNKAPMSAEETARKAKAKKIADKDKNSVCSICQSKPTIWKVAKDYFCRMHKTEAYNQGILASNRR